MANKTVPKMTSEPKFYDEPKPFDPTREKKASNIAWSRPQVNPKQQNSTVAPIPTKNP